MAQLHFFPGGGPHVVVLHDRFDRHPLLDALLPCSLVTRTGRPRTGEGRPGPRPLRRNDLDSSPTIYRAVIAVKLVLTYLLPFRRGHAVVISDKLVGHLEFDRGVSTAETYEEFPRLQGLEVFTLKITSPASAFQWSVPIAPMILMLVEPVTAALMSLDIPLPISVWQRVQHQSILALFLYDRFYKRDGSSEHSSMMP